MCTTARCSPPKGMATAVSQTQARVDAGCVLRQWPLRSGPAMTSASKSIHYTGQDCCMTRVYRPRPARLPCCACTLLSCCDAPAVAAFCLCDIATVAASVVSVCGLCLLGQAGLSCTVCTDFDTKTDTMYGSALTEGHSPDPCPTRRRHASQHATPTEMHADTTNQSKP
jgi:hypothetical protein